jgi:hypothetical protein
VGWRTLDVPVQLLGQLVEGGVSVDGIGIGEVFLEEDESTRAGEDEGVLVAEQLILRKVMLFLSFSLVVGRSGGQII